VVRGPEPRRGEDGGRPARHRRGQRRQPLAVGEAVCGVLPNIARAPEPTRRPSFLLYKLIWARDLTGTPATTRASASSVRREGRERRRDRVPGAPLLPGAPAGSSASSACCAAAAARAENRRFSPLSALRAHTKAPYKMDFHRKTLRSAKGA
jgi:hypothetical protein